MPRAPKHRGHPGCTTPTQNRWCQDHQAMHQMGRRRARQHASMACTAHPSTRRRTQCRDCGAPATEAGHIIPKAADGQGTRDNVKDQCGAISGNTVNNYSNAIYANWYDTGNTPTSEPTRPNRQASSDQDFFLRSYR